MDHAKILDPIQADALTLTPIVTTQDKPDKSEALTLDEAMPKKLVRIHEVEGGDVNNLKMTNNADHPVFLLAGEVIVGGQQDRIIGSNTIVPAKTTQNVPVYCVEHGRWQGDSKEFRTAKALAHGRLRGKAMYEAQQDVWNEVHDKNVKRKTTSDTDTYRQVAAQESDGTLSGMEKKVDTALDQLTPEQRAKLVGFAVSLNGKVATVDVFGSPQLFGKLETKLVRSYLAEAVDVKAEKDIKPPPPAAITTFMSDVAKEKEEDAYETKAAKTTRKKGAHVYKSSTKVEAKPAPEYENYQAH